MLSTKKLLYKILERTSKSLVSAVSNVYWWQGSWTAPSDGILVLRITPNNNTWYWYISDSTISGTTGSWSHQFSGANSNTVTHCIPVKKGSTYSTAASNNLGTLYCFFYPMKVGGYCVTQLFQGLQPFSRRLGVA